MEQVKTRDSQVTIAKAIGIILMVVGHSGCPNSMRHVIYLFHMPLFFILSGYFMTPKDTVGSFFSFCLRKIRKLYLPYLGWGLVAILAHQLFFFVGMYPDGYSMKEFIWHLSHMVCHMEKHDFFFGPGWFLKDLLLGTITVEILFSILSIKSFKYIPIVMCSGFLLFSTISCINGFFIPYLEMDVSRWMLDCSFISAGVILKRIKLDYNKFIIIFISVAFLVMCYLILPMGVEILKYQASDIVPFFVSGISGTILIMSVSLLISKKVKEENFLQYAGSHTMIVLALHFTVFRIMNGILCFILSRPIADSWTFPHIDGVSPIIWVLYSSCGVLIPLFLYRCYERCSDIIHIRR